MRTPRNAAEYGWCGNNFPADGNPKEIRRSGLVYIQTEAEGQPLRAGMASKGLVTRYRGGTGYALDAAMHGAGNRLYVAAVGQDLCGHIEKDLIGRRRMLIYNTLRPPKSFSRGGWLLTGFRLDARPTVWAKRPFSIRNIERRQVQEPTVC